MQQNQREVVILKPTSVFLSFLSAHAPQIELPALSVMNNNTTAYTIPKQDSDEETLNEIERHFKQMFQYEMQRWLGEDIATEIDGSFLDFLCCFKFELHTQIILMEPTVNDAKELLCIKPRSLLLKWMKSSIKEEGEFSYVIERVSLSQITENATVLMKNFAALSDVKPFVEKYYKAIYKAEMFRMCGEASGWPTVHNFEDFQRYFKIEVHTQLVHL